MTDYEPIAALAGHFPSLVQPFTPTLGLVRGRMTEEERTTLNGHRRGCGKAGAPRKYPPAALGQMFGPFKVVTILASNKRFNERVEVACPNGHRRAIFVANARRWKPGKRCPICVCVAEAKRMPAFLLAPSTGAAR